MVFTRLRSVRPSSSVDRLAPASQPVISTRGVAAYTAGTVTLVRPGGSRTPAARATASGRAARWRSGGVATSY